MSIIQLKKQSLPTHVAVVMEVEHNEIKTVNINNQIVDVCGQAIDVCAKPHDRVVYQTVGDDVFILHNLSQPKNKKNIRFGKIHIMLDSGGDIVIQNQNAGVTVTADGQVFIGE